MKKFALLALTMLLIAPHAFAQNSNDARAQVLKNQIEGFLENQKAMALKNGCKLDTKGSITVEKASDYYALTLPHMTYTDSKGIRSEIGMIAVNAVPDGMHDWKVSFALPTPISSFGSGGGEQFRTDIGTQNAAGVWNEKLGHFTSLTANLGNIRLNNLMDQSTVTVGTLSLLTSLTEKDPEAYTGTAKASLSNISMFDAATTFKGSVPAITLTTNLADRAAKEPMTRDQVKNRPQAAQPDFYNVFAFLFGAPEKVTAVVTGLDSVAMQLQQAMITAKPNDRQKLLQGVLGVGAVSAMGQPVAGDAASKSYDVVFTQNGGMSVNGTDIGNLMNSTAPAAGNAITNTPALR